MVAGGIVGAGELGYLGRSTPPASSQRGGRGRSRFGRLDELWVLGHGGGQETLEARDVDGGAVPVLLDAALALELPGDEQREHEPAEGDWQRKELWRGAQRGRERMGRPSGGGRGHHESRTRGGSAAFIKLTKICSKRLLQIWSCHSPW